MSQFNLAADSSQINSFLECQQQWYFRYKQNLEPIAPQHEGFSRGTIFHGMLERYYRHIDEGWEKALSIVTKEFQAKQGELSVDLETFKLLLSRFSTYCGMYQNDLIPVKHNGKLVVESGFSVPIVDNSNFLFVLEGRIDLVAQFDNFVMVVDHKTQARYKKFYPFSLQFMNYALAMNTGRVMINVIGLQEEFKDKNFFRQLFYYSPEKLRVWKKKLELIFYRMANALILESFERNESSCPGKYGYPCDFCKICEETSPEVIVNITKNKYQVREPWSPWSEEE